MHRWFEKLDELGIVSVRLHVLEVDGEAARPFALSDRENVEAMLGFAALQRPLHRLRFDTLSDIENLLVGDDAKAVRLARLRSLHDGRGARGRRGWAFQ